MREILYRGKFKGEWVYGSGHLSPGKSIIINVSETTPTLIEGRHVSRKTIGQYIGLTDKNGKKIFEGDIVNIAYPDTFVMDAVIAYVGVSFWGDTDNDLWELDGYVSLEVIGNIHDNPKLLEGGAE